MTFKKFFFLNKLTYRVPSSIDYETKTEIQNKVCLIFQYWKSNGQFVNIEGENSYNQSNILDSIEIIEKNNKKTLNHEKLMKLKLENIKQISWRIRCDYLIEMKNNQNNLKEESKKEDMDDDIKIEEIKIEDNLISTPKISNKFNQGIKNVSKAVIGIFKYSQSKNNQNDLFSFVDFNKKEVKNFFLMNSFLY